jgi:SAM-dependent methyltransferase
MKTASRSEDRAAFIQQAFWLVLARAPSDAELAEQLRAYVSGEERAVVLRLLSSPEFRLIHGGWTGGSGINRDPGAHEAGLRTLGSHEQFVRRAYIDLFDREADAAGLAHYVEALSRGLSRVDLLRTFVLSDEFSRRYEDFAPGGGFTPRDVQLCELANPAKWDNPEWMAVLRSLQALPDHKLAMHRKTYEFTQLLFGFERLGALRESARILSVGAGHECVLYWLANHVRQVVATDLYEGRWQSESAKEGDAGVLEQPWDYAPFAYRREHLTFLRMDGRRLAFRDGAFDAVYSLSSIEHFGGVAGAREAIDEMARVLAPGGVAAMATEYLLDGQPSHETFTPAQIRELFERPDVRLVQAIDERVYQRYEYPIVDLRRNRHETPHMVVRDHDSVFTSVMVFLQKPDV